MSEVAVQNTSLLALVSQSADLETLLIESGGEITDEISNLLMVKDVAIPEKVENYALVIERFEMISEHYKARANNILKMARAAAAVAERCKDNLKIAMEELQVTELAGVDTKFKLQNSPPSCLIEDDKSLDSAYTTTETIIKIDKKKILEDLKLGVPVKGAKLQTGSYVRAYNNSPTKKVGKK